jgi:hypothetical protein
MPVENGHRSHRFAASRDEAMLRSAVRITPQRRGGEVLLEIAVTDRVGHAFPTGDLFRRLRVSLKGADSTESTTLLARHFSSRPVGIGGSIRIETRDDRPRAGAPQIIRAAFADTTAVRWSVTYERVEFPGSAQRHSPDVLEGSVLLAEGELPPR